MINQGESHKKQRLMQTPYTGAEAVSKLLKNFGQISEAVSRFGNTLNAIHIAAENIEHEFRNLASMMSMTRYSMSMSNNSPMYGAGAKRTTFPSPQERLIEFEVVERAKNNIRDQLKQERGEQPFKDNATRLDEYESFLEAKEEAYKTHKDKMDGLYKRDGKEPVTTETKINEYQKFLDEKFQRLQTYLKKEVDLHASIQQARGINKVAINKVIFDYQESQDSQNKRNKKNKNNNNNSGSDYVSGSAPDYSEMPEVPKKKAAIVVLDFETAGAPGADIQKDKNDYVQSADIIQIAAEFRDDLGNVLETFNVFLDKRSNDISLPSKQQLGGDKFAGLQKAWQEAKDNGSMVTMEDAAAKLKSIIDSIVVPGVTKFVVKDTFDTEIVQNNNTDKNKLLQPVLGPLMQNSDVIDVQDVFKQLFENEKGTDPSKQSATQRAMADVDSTSGVTNYDKQVFTIETMFKALKKPLEDLANELKESSTDLGDFHNALGDVRIESLLYLFAQRKLKIIAKEAAAKNLNPAKGSKGNTASSTNTAPKKPNTTYSSNGGVQKVEVVAPLPLPVIIVGGGANLGGGGGGNGGGGLPTFTVPLIDMDKFLAQSMQAMAKERENQAAAKASGKPASGKNTTNTTNDFSGGKPPVPNDNFKDKEKDSLDQFFNQFVNPTQPVNPPVNSYSPIKDPDFVPSAGTPKTEQQVKDEEAYERQNRSTSSFIDPSTKPITVDPNQSLVVDPQPRPIPLPSVTVDETKLDDVDYCKEKVKEFENKIDELNKTMVDLDDQFENFESSIDKAQQKHADLLSMFDKEMDKGNVDAALPFLEQAKKIPDEIEKIEKDYGKAADQWRNAEDQKNALRSGLQKVVEGANKTPTPPPPVAQPPVAVTPPAPAKEIPPVTEQTPPPKPETPLSRIDRQRAAQKDVPTPEPVAPPKPKAKPAPVTEANKEEGYYAGKHGIEFGFENQSSAQATSSDFINNFIQGIPKLRNNNVVQPPPVLSDSMQDMMKALQELMLPVLNKAQLNTTAEKPGAEGTTAFDNLNDSAQKLVSKFQKMFGLDLTKISNFSASLFGPEATKNKDSENNAAPFTGKNLAQGSFNRLSGAIKINQDANEKGNVLDNSFGTLLHESIHAMFNQLRKQTKIPKLGMIENIDISKISGGNKEELKAIEEMYLSLVARAKTAFIESLAIQNYGDASPANIKNATKDLEGMEYFKEPEEIIATMIGDTFKGKDKEETRYSRKNKSWMSRKGTRKKNEAESTSTFSKGFSAVKNFFGFGGNNEAKEMFDEGDQTDNNSSNEISKEDEIKSLQAKVNETEKTLDNVQHEFSKKQQNDPNVQKAIKNYNKIREELRQDDEVHEEYKDPKVQQDYEERLEKADDLISQAMQDFKNSEAGIDLKIADSKYKEAKTNLKEAKQNLRLADAESVLYDPASPSMANVGGNVETPFLEKDKNKPNALLSNQRSEIFKRDVSSASSEQLQADLDQIADLLQGPAKNSPLFLKMARVQQTKINDQLNRLDAIKKGVTGPFESKEQEEDVYNQLQFEREYKNLEQPTPAPAKALTATELIAKKKAELKAPEEPKKEDEKLLEKKDSKQEPGKRERGENISLMEAFSQSFDRLIGKAYTKGYDPHETFDKRADGVSGVVSGAKDKASNLLDKFSGVPDIINDALNSDIKIPFLPKEQTEEQRLNGGKTYSYTGYTTDEKGKKTETQGEVSANSWTEAVQKLNEQGAIFVEKIAEVNGGMEGFIKNSLRPDAAVSEQNSSTVQYLDFLRDKLNTNEMNNSNTDGSLTDQGILESNKLLQEIVNTLIAIRGEKLEPAPQKMDAETEEIVNNRNLDNASQGAYSRETSQVAGDIISGGAGNKDTTKPIPFKIDTDNFPTLPQNLDINSPSEPYANLPFPNQPIIPFDSNDPDSNQAPKNAAPQSAEMAALLSGYQQEFPTSSLPVKNPQADASKGIPQGAIDPQNIITPNATEPVRASLSPLDIGALLDPKEKPIPSTFNTADTGDGPDSKDVTVSGSVPIDVNVLNIGDIKPSPAPSSDSSSDATRSVDKNKPIPGFAKGGIIGKGVNNFISKGFGSDEDEGPKGPDKYPAYLAKNEAVLPENSVKNNKNIVSDLLKGKKIKYMKKGGMGGGGSAPTATSSSSGSAPKFDPRVLTPKGDIFGPIKQWVSDFSNNTRIGFIGKSVMDFGKALQGTLNGLAGFVKAASPDAFSTLTGSIQLLMGAIGVQFIPIILRVSAILQSWYQDILMGEGVVGEFVAKVAGWINEMPEDMLEGLVGIALVVAGIVALAPVFAGLMAVVGIVAGGFSLLMTGLGLVVSTLGIAFAGISAACTFLLSPLGLLALGVLACIELFTGFRGPITKAGELIGEAAVIAAKKIGLMGKDESKAQTREDAGSKAKFDEWMGKNSKKGDIKDEREAATDYAKQSRDEISSLEKRKKNFNNGNGDLEFYKDESGKTHQMTNEDYDALIQGERKNLNTAENYLVVNQQKKEGTKGLDPDSKAAQDKIKEIEDKAKALANPPKPAAGGALSLIPGMDAITGQFAALGGKMKDAISGLLTSGPNGKGKNEEYDRGAGLDKGLEKGKINDKEYEKQKAAQERRTTRIGTKDEAADDKENSLKFGKFNTKYTKQKEDEGNRKKEGEQKTLAMSFSKEKAQASFSSVDEAYKKIQVSALGDDPMTAEMKKLNEVGMVALLQAMNRGQAGDKQNADKIVAGGGLAK